MLAKNKLNSVLFGTMLKRAGHVLVFDSGVGGLSVVAELRTLMPDIYITYAADDEFRPYGSKSEAQLKDRLPRLLKTLVLMTDPDAVVIACNTASTTALSEIRSVLEIPVIGVVPAVKPAAQMSQRKTIAVLGTPGTVRRKYVDKLIADFAGDCQVILHGSTGLVDLAERKLAGEILKTNPVKTELAPMFATKNGSDIDIVVLACTHFPLLLDELKRAVPRPVTWIDSGAAIARRTQTVLKDVKLKPIPHTPQTALLIGGQENKARRKMFKKYGFLITVCL